MNMLSYLLIVLFSSTVSSFGAIAAVDDFESYGAGELNGLNGGSGFSNAWSAVDGVTEIVDISGNDLSYSGSGGSVISGGDKALSITGNNALAIDRTFSSALTDTFYVGFLFRAETGTALQNNDFLAINLGDATRAEGVGFGVKANQGNGSGSSDFYSRMSFNDGDQYSTNITIGETYYLVAKVSKTSGGNYNRVELFVNPTVGGESSPSTVSVGTGSLSSIDRISIRSVNIDSSDDFTIGGFTIGSEWNDVVPVPEPSSSLLVILGLGFSLMKRKRT